jgi:hypothetical protein
MLRTGKIGDPSRVDYVVGETASPVDNLYDTVLRVGMNDVTTRTIDVVEDAVKDAGIRFAQDNNGQLPTTPDQLTPYLKQAIDPAQVQRVLGSIPPGVTTLINSKPLCTSLITSAYTPLLSSPSILSDQCRPVYLCTGSPYPLCTYPAFQARRHVHQHNCRSIRTGSFCAVRSLSASSRLTDSFTDSGPSAGADPCCSRTKTWSRRSELDASSAFSGLKMLDFADQSCTTPRQPIPAPFQHFC